MTDNETNRPGKCTEIRKLLRIWIYNFSFYPNWVLCNVFRFGFHPFNLFKSLEISSPDVLADLFSISSHFSSSLLWNIDVALQWGSSRSATPHPPDPETWLLSRLPDVGSPRTPDVNTNIFSTDSGVFGQINTSSRWRFSPGVILYDLCGAMALLNTFTL